MRTFNNLRQLNMTNQIFPLTIFNGFVMSSFIKQRTVCRQSFENRIKLIGNPFLCNTDEFLLSGTESEENVDIEIDVTPESEDESSLEDFTYKKEKIEKKKVLKKKSTKKRKKIEEKSTTTKKPTIDLTCKWGENEQEEQKNHILKPSIIERIKQLKGEIDETTFLQTQRFYSKSNIAIPPEIQFFLDVKWPKDLRCINFNI